MLRPTPAPRRQPSTSCQFCRSWCDGCRRGAPRGVGDRDGEIRRLKEAAETETEGEGGDRRGAMIGRVGPLIGAGFGLFTGQPVRGRTKKEGRGGGRGCEGLEGLGGGVSGPGGYGEVSGTEAKAGEAGGAWERLIFEARVKRTGARRRRDGVEGGQHERRRRCGSHEREGSRTERTAQGGLVKDDTSRYEEKTPKRTRQTRGRNGEERGKFTSCLLFRVHAFSPQF